MQPSSSDTESFVVSRYLEEVSDLTRVVDLVAETDERIGRRLSAARAAGDLVLLAHCLEPTVFALSRRRFERLQALSARPSIETDAVPEDFLRTGLVLPLEEAFSIHGYRTFEIEINRHCNLRCCFCPVATDPKPAGTMDWELYDLVLQRVVEYGARHIALNHYGEPTVDPMLERRLALAYDRDLNVTLNTNATGLSQTMIARLAEWGNTLVNVNLPSLDKETYARVTGSKLYDRVVANLERLFSAGVQTVLSVNVPVDTAQDELEAINARFSDMFGPTERWPTGSRAGLITDSSYAREVRHRGRLGGCRIALSRASISYRGELFLCCQDYYQKHILGDLKTSTVRAAAQSDAAVSLRRQIFGAEAPSEGLICRSCEATRPFVSTTFAVGAPLPARRQNVPAFDRVELLLEGGSECR